VTFSEIAGVLLLSAPFILLIIHEMRPKEEPRRSRGVFSQENSIPLDPAAKARLIKNIESIMRALRSRQYSMKDASFVANGANTKDSATIGSEAYSLCQHCGIQGISVAATFDALKEEFESVSNHTADAAGHVFRFGPRQIQHLDQSKVQRHTGSDWSDPSP
jgi:hypothetical protein